MLGELVSDGKGKRTCRRVLCVEPHFKVEVSFEEMGAVFGAPGVNIGTYTSTTKPDGSLDGEGMGVFATLEGDLITWKALASGWFGEGGSVSYRGSISYNTTSPKFARLNRVAGVFEFEGDAAGNTASKVWEWK